MGEYLQHLMETNNTKELEILKNILEKVHAELTEEVIKDVKRQIGTMLEILRKK